IHQPFNWNKTAIDKEAVARRKIQITARILIAQGKASDADGSHAPVPGGAILPERLPSNPLDGQWPTEGLNESTDCQIFNGNLTVRSLNVGPAEETTGRRYRNSACSLG